MFDDKTASAFEAEHSSSGLQMCNPPLTSQVALPGSQTRPLAVLFDPSPLRLTTANKLARTSGWRVLAVDSNSATNVRTAIDMLAPTQSTNLYLAKARIIPQAIIMEAAHPATFPQQQAYDQRHSGEVGEAQNRNLNDSQSDDSTLLPAQALVHWLLLRSVALKLSFAGNEPSYQPNDPHPTIPVILYTANAAALKEVKTVTAVVARRFPDLEVELELEPLVSVLAHLTGLVFCKHCQSHIKPNAPALLVRPASIYCASCAHKYSGVTVTTTAHIDTDTTPSNSTRLFPARLLAMAAARAFIMDTTTPPPPPTSTTVQQGNDSNRADPWQVAASSSPSSSPTLSSPSSSSPAIFSPPTRTTAAYADDNNTKGSPYLYPIKGGKQL